MIRISRYAFCALLAMAALSLQGQSAFNGTWHFDMSKTKFSDKPDVFYTSQGWYHCDTCTPAYTVQADGQDHSVTGQAVDTMSVALVDDHTIHLVGKKSGKVATDITQTVSADGKILSMKFSGFPPDGQPFNFEGTEKRVGTLPAGVHATSGKWIMQHAKGSENALITTYKVNGDEVNMTDPVGDSYTAKVDGPEAPVKSFGWDTVQLKKVDDHTIDETDKFKGTIIGTDKMTVSPNGKSLTVVVTQQPSGQVTTYFGTKQ